MPADILLHIDSYPEPTSHEAIEQAIGFAKSLGARLSALALRVHFPVRSNFIADYLIGLSDLAEAEEAKSLAACHDCLDHFKVQAERAGVFGEALLEPVEFFLAPDRVALKARTRDFSIIPVEKPLDGQGEVVRSVIFGSGRPAVIFRHGVSRLPVAPFGLIVVAWDGSATAARAMADALPLLQRAREVRVLTIINEKPTAITGSGAEAVRHLRVHGVAAEVEEVDAAGGRIDGVLDAYLARRAPDLFVMGAYGRSRVREFVLGGATEHMLFEPKTPLFLSH